MDFSLQLRTLLSAGLAACFVVMCIGCGDGRPERVPISGTVLIDDQPLDGAFVKFVPAEGRPAGAKTDANGRFTLTCYEKDDGATLGTHQVSVRACKDITSLKMKWFAPKKYMDVATSGLSVEVTGPKDDVVIHLTWDGGKPFVENDPAAL